MSASYAYYALPAGPPGDHHEPPALKPSERFARPVGPVFLVDEERRERSHPRRDPASTYMHTQRQHPHCARSSLSTPGRTPGGKSEGSPPASGEESIPAVLVLPYRNHDSRYDDPAVPKLPPKTGARSNRPTRLNLPLGHAAAEHEQESRDQLSPLLSSPRKLDYGGHDANHAVARTTSAPTNTVDAKDAYITPQQAKSPRRRPFFSFGRSASGKVAASPEPTSNTEAEGKLATSYLGNRDSSHELSTTRDFKSNKHARRNSADDVDVHKNPYVSPGGMPMLSGIGSAHGDPQEAVSSLSGEMRTITVQDIGIGGKRTGRTSTRDIFQGLGRRSRSAGRAGMNNAPVPLSPSPPPPVPPAPLQQHRGTLANNTSGRRRGSGVTSNNPYENSQTQADGIAVALHEDWVALPASSRRTGERNSTDPFSHREGGRGTQSDSPRTNVEDWLQENRKPDAVYNQEHTQLPKTPSPVKSRHQYVNSPSHGRTDATPLASQTVHSSTRSTASPSLPQLSPKKKVHSPPFFMRGRLATQKKSLAEKGVSPSDADLPGSKGNGVPSPVTPPKSPSRITAEPAPRTIAAWPAESLVFGAAQAVIGKATIGPHVAPYSDLPSSKTTLKPSAMLPSWSPRSDAKIRTAELGHATPVAASANEDDDVFGRDTPLQDTRKRVVDLLNITQSRKSSLYTAASSLASSGTNTPLPRSCTGRPRIEESILEFPVTILAGLLDHLSFRSFKRLLHSSPKLYRAAFYETDHNTFIEVVKQRYLAPYGYLPLPMPISSINKKRSATNTIDFTMKDLNAFLVGMEFSLAEYSIFASEHKRLPLRTSATRMLRESTRSFNKLVFRLQAQAYYTESLPRLLNPYWASYKRTDQQNQVFKIGRCALLRVWMPCDSHWMTDQEIVEVEREIHRAGIWKLLKKGDLVRNIALGDIANEGMLIFDGKYLRDLSYRFDTIGHLPSWVNAMTFSPSYFHNQIASATSEPIVYLDLTPFQTAVQTNLLLCKEKVDLASPSGDQYKVTRYVYRTVVELIPDAVLGEASSTGELESLHPDWAGQLIVETDGTTEAAKALLQRVIPISRELITPDQPKIPAHVNNRPYAILRNLSRPGLIFCRVIPDTKPGEEFGH